MSQIRAVEHGRAVLIAATSGVTAIINPAGDVVAQAPVLEPGYLVDEVPLRDSITIADRVGAWPEWLLFLAVLFGVTLSVVQHRKSSRLEGNRRMTAMTIHCLPSGKVARPSNERVNRV